MLRALALSLAQLGDRSILRLFLLSLALTLLILAVLAALIIWGTQSVLVDGFALDRQWGTLGAAAAGIVALLGGWLLFRMVAIAVIGLFADGVVEVVEARHYPDRRDSARPVAFGRSVRMALASAGRALAVNLILLPLYLFLLVTGVGTAALFFAANSWLLGRDLGDMVAARHMDDSAMKGWRRSTALSRLALGAIGTAMLLVPIAGLFGPILGAAMATHLFHMKEKR